MTTRYVHAENSQLKKSEEEKITKKIHYSLRVCVLIFQT